MERARGGAFRGLAGRHRRVATTAAAGANLLRYVFLHPRAPSFIVDWPERARRLVAEYRADTAAWHETRCAEPWSMS